MVPEGFLRLGISPEALSLGVIVVINFLAVPVLVTLDAEVVVRSSGKGGFACA